MEWGAWKRKNTQRYGMGFPLWVPTLRALSLGSADTQRLQDKLSPELWAVTQPTRVGWARVSPWAEQV